MSAVRGNCRCSTTGRTCYASYRIKSRCFVSPGVSHRQRVLSPQTSRQASIDDRNGFMPLEADVPEGVLNPAAYHEYMQEYKDLKELLLDRTRQSGAAIALYLFLTANGEAALCALMGCAFSYGYMMWLCHDIDNIKPGDRIPIAEAEKIQVPMARSIAKVGAAFQTSINPRLLVPIVLAAGTAAFSAKMGPIDRVYEGCLLAGFLSYKIALITKVVDEQTPKAEVAPAAKPVPVQVDDEFDMYGRPKARLAQPTDVLPESEREKIIEAAGNLPVLKSEEERD